MPKRNSMKSERPTVSICIIVKNERDNLPSLIDNVSSFADEVIIVDTGSSDGSLIILTREAEINPKVKIHSYSANGNFHYGIAKNFAIKKANKDYIIILDADERLSEEFKINLLSFLQSKTPEVARVRRIDDLVPHLVEYPERIIKNNKNIFYRDDEMGRVHESLLHPHVPVLYDFVVHHSKGDKHQLIAPHKGLFQLELQIERIPKTKTFLGHFIRGVWYFFTDLKKIILLVNYIRMEH